MMDGWSDGSIDPRTSSYAVLLYPKARRENASTGINRRRRGILQTVNVWVNMGALTFIYLPNLVVATHCHLYSTLALLRAVPIGDGWLDGPAC